MQMDRATAVLECLSSGLRLEVYRTPIKKGQEGMVAGEIASTLAIPPTNLSFHLKSLTHAGLLSVSQEGRFQRYRADLTPIRDLIAYLTQECCAGHPEQCLNLREPSQRSDAVPSAS